MPLPLGCVVRTPEQVRRATTLPIDYLELKGDMLCVEPDALRALGAAVRDTGLPARAMTSPLPRRFGCRVVGDDADHAAAMKVFADMCRRGADLGVRTVVLGSGQARSFPADYPRDTAVRQFRDFVALAAAECRALGMSLTLEPLTAAETNFVNNCAEAREVLDGLADTDVTIAVDCYHVVSEGRPVAAEVRAARGAIGHAHTSSIPRGGMDFRTDVQREFVASLLAAGYTGGLTVEEEFTDFAAQAPYAISVFRDVLAAQS